MKIFIRVLAFLLVSLLCMTGALGDSEDRLDLENNKVFFGTYPQTKDGTDRTPIEWIVLEKSDKAALLLSRYVLVEQPFHTNFLDKIYWDNCSLRSWLNSTFLNDAFTEEEQKAIYLVNIDNSRLQGRPNGGNTSVDRETTKDYVFLLSYSEVFDKYLKKEDKRICLMTDYVLAQRNGKVYKKQNGKGIAAWWLRSPIYPKEGMIVTYMGNMLDQNNSSKAGVRPAIIISLTSDVFEK